MNPFTHWLNSLAGAPAPEADLSPPADVDDLREQVLALLHDCNGLATENMRVRLARARTAQDLWNARSDLFNLIAHRHCESQAVQRINGLVPLFEGSLPAGLLRPVGGSSAAA